MKVEEKVWTRALVFDGLESSQEDLPRESHLGLTKTCLVLFLCLCVCVFEEMMERKARQQSGKGNARKRKEKETRRQGGKHRLAF